MTTHLREIPRASAPAANAASAVTVDGVRIALFDVDGTILAVEDACLRCASPLSAGAVADAAVTCPGCGWRYDIATGASRQVPALKIHTFTARVEPLRLTIEWPGPGD